MCVFVFEVPVLCPALLLVVGVALLVGDPVTIRVIFSVTLLLWHLSKKTIFRNSYFYIDHRVIPVVVAVVVVEGGK